MHSANKRIPAVLGWSASGIRSCDSCTVQDTYTLSATPELGGILAVKKKEWREVVYLTANSPHGTGTAVRASLVNMLHHAIRRK